jgi:hypothetical protein
MKHARTKPTQGRRSLFAFGAAALLAVAATAQVSTLEDLNFNEQMQACQRGDTPQSTQSCMQEARAARAARAQGALDPRAGDYAGNALARCDAFQSAEDQRACRARVMGQGEVSGSVAGGGMLRQYEYKVPAAASGAGSSGAMGAGSMANGMDTNAPPRAIAAEPLMNRPQGPSAAPASPMSPR